MSRMRIGSLLVAILVLALVVPYAGAQAPRKSAVPVPVPAAAAPAPPSADGVQPTNITKAELSMVSWGDLTDAQVAEVLKVINVVGCPCGCKKPGTNVADTLAECRRDDPKCPVAPGMIDRAIGMARGGANADAIRAGLEKMAAERRAAQKQAAPEQPAYVADIPVGRSPTTGPKTAPVTIVEVSDFQ